MANNKRTYTINVQADVSDLIKKIMEAQKKLGDMGEGISIGEGIDFDGMKKEFERALNAMKDDLEKLKVDHIEFGKINTAPLEDLFEKFENINTQVKNINTNWSKLDFTSKTKELTTSLESFKQAANDIKTVLEEFSGTAVRTSAPKKTNIDKETQEILDRYKLHRKLQQEEEKRSNESYGFSSDLNAKKQQAIELDIMYDSLNNQADNAAQKLKASKKGTAEYNKLLKEQIQIYSEARAMARKLSDLLEDVSFEDENFAIGGQYADEKIEAIGKKIKTYRDFLKKDEDNLVKQIKQKGLDIPKLIHEQNKQTKTTFGTNLDIPISIQLTKESLTISDDIKKIINDAKNFAEQQKIELDLRIKKDSQAEKDIETLSKRIIAEQDIYRNVDKVYRQLSSNTAKKNQAIFGINPEAMQQLMSTITSKMGEMGAPAAQSMQEIVDSINRVITALEKLGNTARTAFNLPSDAELTSQWTDIESSFKKIVDKKGNIDLRKNKGAVNEILTSYAKYSKNGGSHSLVELTSNAATLKKLSDAYKKIDIIDNQEIQKDNETILQLKSTLEQLATVLEHFDVSSKSFETAAKIIADNLKQIVDTNQQYIDQIQELQKSKKDYAGEIELEKQKTKDVKAVLTHKDKLKAKEHERKIEENNLKASLKKEEMMIHDHNIEMMHENNRVHQEKMAKQKFQNEVTLKDLEKRNKAELANQKEQLLRERNQQKELAKNHQKYVSDYYSERGLTKTNAKHYDFSQSHQGVQNKANTILSAIASLKTKGNKLAKISVEDITGIELAELKSITVQLAEYRKELEKLQTSENKKYDEQLRHDRNRAEKLQDEQRRLKEQQKAEELRYQRNRQDKLEDEARKTAQKEATSIKDRFYKAKEKYLGSEGKFYDKEKKYVFDLASDETQQKANKIRTIIADLKKEAQAIMALDIEFITEDDIAKLGSYSTRIDSLSSELKTLNTAALKEVKNIQEKLFPNQRNQYDFNQKMLQHSLGNVTLDGQTDKVKQDVENIRTMFALIEQEVKNITSKDINLISDQDVKLLAFYSNELQGLGQTIRTLFPPEAKNNYAETVFNLMNKFKTKQSDPLNNVLNNIDPSQKTNTFNTHMTQYIGQIKEIENRIFSLQNKELELIDAEDVKEVRELMDVYDELSEIITSLNKNKQYNRFDPVKGTVISEGAKDYAKAYKEVQRLTEARGKLVKDIQISQATPDVAKFTATVKTQTGEVQKLSYAWDGASGNIRQVVTTMKQGQSGMTAFTGAIKDGFVRFGKYFTGDRIISSAIRAFRTGIVEIKELDSAFTEMQKVSDATTLALKEFSEESFNIGKSIGATGLAIQQSSADWMRLGLI